MPLDMIIGAQWGDEGKGRVTDLLAAQTDIVARFSGGDNGSANSEYSHNSNLYRDMSQT